MEDPSRHPCKNCKWFYLGARRRHLTQWHWVHAAVFEVLPFVSRLYMGGFQGISFTNNPRYVLASLCRHNQRHQPESVQMMLDLGVVSCDEQMVYTPSKGSIVEWYSACPIVAVAVAEQNAGAVAVLVAAGAVLPAPSTTMAFRQCWKSWSSRQQQEGVWRRLSSTGQLLRW